ncbi:hypothetical protein JW877_02840 [bacterium]|nr:hypothetical protein [bacterium]
MSNFKYFLIVFSMLFLTQSFLSADCESDWEDRPYPLDHGWAFTNWATVTPLSQDDLERVYIDINEGSPFGGALYTLYTSLVTGMANCSGMSLLSVIIRKEQGHMGFCNPIHFYDGNVSHTGTSDPADLMCSLIDCAPEDTMLAKVIKMMQAKLLTYEFLDFLAEIILDIKEVEDPEYAYEQAQYYLSEGDLPLLIMVSDNFEAHTIVPYCCQEVGGKKRMYVYDPNRPYIDNKTATSSTINYDNIRAFYDSSLNYVEVEKVSGTYYWNFQFGDTTVWPGNSWYSMLCPIITVPYSLWKTAYNSPFMFAAEVATSLTGVADMLFPGLGASIDIFCALAMAGASATQITDQEGRRFFTSDNNFHHYSDLERDSTKTIPNMFFFPMAFGNGPNQPQMFIVRGAGANLNVGLYSQSGNYDFQVASPLTNFTLKGSGGKGGKDRIELGAISTGMQTFKIQPESGQKAYKVTLEILDRKEKSRKTFEITNLNISAGSPVTMAFTRGDEKGAEGMLIRSDVQKLQYDLTITKTEMGKKPVSIKQNAIQVDPGTWSKQAPKEWKNLKDSNIKIDDYKGSIRIDDHDDSNK